MQVRKAFVAPELTEEQSLSTLTLGQGCVSGQTCAG
jgi:hypothetical protein